MISRERSRTDADSIHCLRHGIAFLSMTMTLWMASGSWAADELAPVSLTRQAEDLKTLAATGDPDAKTRLAQHYERGWGVPQDFGKAIRLYREAATDRHGPALERLTALGVSIFEPVDDLDEADEQVVEPRVTQLTISKTKYVEVPDDRVFPTTHSAFSDHEIFFLPRQKAQRRVITGRGDRGRRLRDHGSIERRRGVERRPQRVTDFPVR